MKQLRRFFLTVIQLIFEKMHKKEVFRDNYTIKNRQKCEIEDKKRLRLLDKFGEENNQIEKRKKRLEKTKFVTWSLPWIL